MPLASPSEVTAVQSIRDAIHQKNLIQGSQDIYDLAEEYRQRYEDWIHCHLFHVMASSTPPQDSKLYPDFPGRDSVPARLQQIFDAL